MSLRSFLRTAAPALAVVALGFGVAAPASAAGDPVHGKVVGYTCLGCHGIETYKNVYPTYSVPRLRGQHTQYIVNALKAYRSGDRSHSTMHAHASAMSDQDIEDVAAYLAGEQIEADANAKPVGTPPAAAETCKTCHGPVGVPDAANRQAGAATLAGQHADYLQHALERYRIGARKNALMQPFATQLKPEDIRALAEFYSRQQPALKTVPLRENVVTGQK